VPHGFRYRRRVQFAETDMAGIVHFSSMFKYMEEAEHALWRAAGMTIARAGGPIAWPRLAAAFEFQRPLFFEDEFDVTVEISAITSRTIRYAFTIARDETTIGTGTMTTACVRKGDDVVMKAVELPADIVARLSGVVDRKDA
jgi:acyl-CoA thioester hydrolase